MINMAELLAAHAQLAREVVTEGEQAQAREAVGVEQSAAPSARGSVYPAKQLVFENGSYVAADPGK